MSDTKESTEKNQPQTPEYPDTDYEDFDYPGDENIAIPLKYDPEQYEVEEDDESPMVYERSKIPTTPDEDQDDDDDDDDDDDLGEEEDDEEEESKSPPPADIDPSMYEEKNEDDEEEDSDDDDEALKKLDRDIDNDILLKSHPEIIQNNYQEILALCTLVKNDKGVIVDELHKTYPFMTKYEYARIIGIRAKQINNGADPFIKVNRGIIDGFTIAKMEMEQKKVPFIIARPLPNGSREYWKVQDLEMIHF